MPTTAQLRSRLVSKLKELFQLDQPDLDFGFYRIMHAKAQQVTEFLEKDLLKVITDTFGSQADHQSAATLANARRELEETLGGEALDENGRLKEAFATLPAGRRYLDAVTKAEAAKEAMSAEGEIYDHLYRFFERYYEDGDFVSRRYFSRETDGRAAPFAIPYNGEEVKLHWANADQYYIKTGEYFANFTVDLAKTTEVVGKEDELGLEHRNQPLIVHFRLVDAVEGEHGNVKASDATKRFFLLHEAAPVGLNAKGELELRFEYRPDPDKPDKSQEGTWQEHRRAEAVAKLLATLAPLTEAAAYHRLLSAKAPTEANEDRTLLAKYLHQYTARNTSDYFIHKDLGGFLRRELDFYIKNEVMRLDDIEDDDAPRVESYLAKIKVLRSIARQFIAFLAQLEDFQKKLWLKKKFVVETNYGITLDRVPQELYPEIAANDAQQKEWVELFAINDIQGRKEDDLLQSTTSGYSSPLTLEFLKSQPYLVLDTRHFSEDFKARLMASFESFDEQCDGLLIHSENFQGMQHLLERYRGTIGCIYSDPPYNTGTDGFAYKDAFWHSSWGVMMLDRMSLARELLDAKGSIFVQIDDYEEHNLRHILDSVFSSGRRINRIAWVRTFNSGSSKGLSQKLPSNLDTIFWYAKSSIYTHNKILRPYSDGAQKRYDKVDVDGRRFKWNPMKTYSEAKLQRLLATGDAMWTENSKYPVYKKYLNDDSGAPLDNHWHDIAPIGTFAAERTGFTTQKPVKLIERCISLAAADMSLDFFGGSGTTGHAVINLNREDNGGRKYVLIEMGEHFDTVLKPRIAKVIYSPEWKDGKPTSRSAGLSHCFKYIRLESYEDTLNNLRFSDDAKRQSGMAANEPLRRDYTLNYLLDVETRGSQSLLNISDFSDPTAYKLKVKKPGATSSVEQSVDLIETFNFLIGLRLDHLDVPQRFTASFKRVPDADLPAGTDTRLQLDGRMTQSGDGLWWFRKVEGWVPKDRENPNNGQKEKILIVWRTLTGNLEEDNLMLDEWFQKNRLSTRDFEFNTIYVNGSNNLPNLKLDTDTWKVRLIEEEFSKAMWDVQGV